MATIRNSEARTPRGGGPGGNHGATRDSRGNSRPKRARGGSVRGNGGNCGSTGGRGGNRGSTRGRGSNRGSGRGRGSNRGSGRGRKRVILSEAEILNIDASSGWKSSDWVPKNISFTGKPGPCAAAAQLGDDDPVKFFQLFMNDEILEHLVEQTNLYANQSIDSERAKGKQLQHSRSKAWKPVNIYEMKKFLGLMFLTGIIRKPTLEDYWSTDSMIETPIFGKVMSRNRFEIILSYLHFNDNEKRSPNCDDRLYKVRPIIDHFVGKFREMYNPHENISIDEGMLSWRGRLGFRVYNPKKPVKYGVKSYILTDSVNSYCWNLKPYCGVGNTLKDTVLELLDNLINQGFKLFMDNFYNSFGLSERLLQLGTHTCGTLRVDRGEPKAISKATTSNMEVGDVVVRHKNDIMCLAWRDKRIVQMISTIGDDKMIEITVRKRGHPDGVPKKKPHCIVLYNASMGGVDKLDQCVKYYPFTRKSVKWTKKFIFYLFQIAMYNSFVIYKEKITQRKCKSLYEYILAITESYILSSGDDSDSDSDNDSQRPSLAGTPRAASHDPPTRLDGRMRNHTLEPIAATAKKKFPSRKCRVRVKHGERKETRYVCSTCHVPLHKGDCFTRYHTTENY